MCTVDSAFRSAAYVREVAPMRMLRDARIRGQGAVTAAYLWPRYPAPGTHHTMRASTRVGQAPNYPAGILEVVAQVVGVGVNLTSRPPQFLGSASKAPEGLGGR